MTTQKPIKQKNSYERGRSLKLTNNVLIGVFFYKEDVYGRDCSQLIKYHKKPTMYRIWLSNRPIMLLKKQIAYQTKIPIYGEIIKILPRQLNVMSHAWLYLQYHYSVPILWNTNWYAHSFYKFPTTVMLLLCCMSISPKVIYPHNSRELQPRSDSWLKLGNNNRQNITVYRPNI
jgi:hypothetical protein